MTLFSNFIFMGVINYRGIDDASSVKGSLSDAFGKGLANRDVWIYANNIVMGKVTTDSEGCFYFNSWNNTSLKPLIDKYAHSIGFKVKI